MNKIIIDLIVANVCNMVCNYCPIKFDGKILDSASVDFILKYLILHRDVYDKCLINFFGGEPLINYKNVKYFIENNKNTKIEYSLGTNGFLLTEDKLDFFIDHNVKIYLSLHADKKKSYQKLLERTYLFKSTNMEINFIVSPFYIDQCYEKLERILKLGCKKINIIPIMLTEKWDLSAIIELNRFINYVDKNYIDIDRTDLTISKYSFFDGISEDKTFVIDNDLNIFQDSSDELFIGKQYDVLGDSLQKELHEKTFLGNIKTHPLDYFLNIYSPGDITRLVYKLPKKMGYVKDYILIHKIMDKKNMNGRRGANVIF